MKLNIFLAGCFVGLICSFIASQIDEKDMIERGYVHNIFLGIVKVSDGN